MMSSGVTGISGVARTRGVAWWRFPSNWIVSNPSNEDRFSKIVWLSVLLQYFVLARFPTGLRGEYVAVALVSVVSIAALFGMSLVFALAYYRKPIQNEKRLREVEERFGSRYAFGVRNWAIALIVSWMAVHVVLAISFAIGGEKGDLMDQLICRLWPNSECYDVLPELGLLTFAEYLIYTAIAVALVAGIAALHRKLRGVTLDPPPLAEPNLAYVIVAVAALLTIINSSTVTH